MATEFGSSIIPKPTKSLIEESKNEEICVYFAGKMRPTFNQILVQDKDILKIRDSLKKEDFEVLINYYVKYKLQKDGIQYYYRSVGPFMSPESISTSVDKYRSSDILSSSSDVDERVPIPVGQLFKISYNQIINCEAFFALVEPSSFGTLCEIIHAYCQEKMIVLQFHNVRDEDMYNYDLYIFLAWLSLNSSYSTAALKERYDFLLRTNLLTGKHVNLIHYF